MDTKALDLISILWDYLKIDQPLQSSDLILAMGCHDTRVAERAAEIYNQGFAQKVLFVGGLGRITKDLWDIPEAEKYKEIAINLGVPESAIFLETKSTNTIENIKFGKRLLNDQEVKHERIIWVAKPYNQLRTKISLSVLWPDQEFIFTSSQLSLQAYLSWYEENRFLSVEDIFNIIVGEVQRIKIYLDNDSMILEPIPARVLDAYNDLLSLGYDQKFEKDPKGYWEGFLRLKESMAKYL